MIPYIHIGPLTLPTFGLMVATALLCAAYLLQKDFDRRGWSADGYSMITYAGLAGMLGAKLYHSLETPAEFFADPWPQIFSRTGFAWFGGFLGGFGVMLYLGRRAKLPMLEFLDACSPAAAVGYGIGRIGCLLSGDGDYGKPTSWQWPWGMAFPNGIVPTTETCVQWGGPSDCRVYPTPLYEFFVWLAIGALLWRMGTKRAGQHKAGGEIFCFYLILTGVARFLVEIIRINPRTFLGMSNAQTMGAVSAIAGAALLWHVKRAGKAKEQQLSPLKK
jgi:phosphatidylglycerol:prolipoprotein diacylglycerol transferase